MNKLETIKIFLRRSGSHFPCSQTLGSWLEAPVPYLFGHHSCRAMHCAQFYLDSTPRVTSQQTESFFPAVTWQHWGMHDPLQKGLFAPASSLTFPSASCLLCSYPFGLISLTPLSTWPWPASIFHSSQLSGCNKCCKTMELENIIPNGVSQLQKTHMVFTYR